MDYTNYESIMLRLAEINNITTELLKEKAELEMYKHLLHTETQVGKTTCVKRHKMVNWILSLFG